MLLTPPSLLQLNMAMSDADRICFHVRRHSIMCLIYLHLRSYELVGQEDLLSSDKQGKKTKKQY